MPKAKHKKTLKKRAVDSELSDVGTSEREKRVVVSPCCAAAQFRVGRGLRSRILPPSSSPGNSTIRFRYPLFDLEEDREEDRLS